jgi:hypothetical protein
VDEEAGYRPDIFYVIAFVRAYTLQTWKIAPRPKGAPADWFAPCEDEYAMGLTILYEIFKRFFALSPLISFQTLRLSARHHMHQHPAQAPFGPNRRSTAGHKLGRNSSKRMFLGTVKSFLSLLFLRP